MVTAFLRGEIPRKDLDRVEGISRRRRWLSDKKANACAVGRNSCASPAVMMP